jgi:hypothetical protein
LIDRIGDFIGANAWRHQCQAQEDQGNGDTTVPALFHFSTTQRFEIGCCEGRSIGVLHPAALVDLLALTVNLYAPASLSLSIGTSTVVK